jgi:hypothetical protein
MTGCDGGIIKGTNQIFVLRTEEDHEISQTGLQAKIRTRDVQSTLSILILFFSRYKQVNDIHDCSEQQKSCATIKFRLKLRTFT